MAAKRVGILGGSFNPVHNGHLHLAERGRAILGLSEVHFVVAGLPPHKLPPSLIEYHHRYAMVSLATAGCPEFLPSQAEIEPPASPFSIDTLAKIARRLAVPGEDIYFIAGGDSLRDVAAWHESDRLLENYNFVFVMRPGIAVPEVRSLLPAPSAARALDCRGLPAETAQARTAAAVEAGGCRVFVLETGAPEIAASDVRRMAAAGEDFGRLVPAPVCEYILKLHLYGER